MRLILIFTTVLLSMVTTIKASDSMMIHIPLNIEIDPMERLLLVNFENDPDTLYVGFEPQVFDDPVNGQGHLDIGWRIDGRLDVYHEAGLNLTPIRQNMTLPAKAGQTCLSGKCRMLFLRSLIKAHRQNTAHMRVN